jgi:hypothetical protein
MCSLPYACACIAGGRGTSNHRLRFVRQAALPPVEVAMARQALILGMLVLAGACTTEHRTVVMSADDPCTSYGFTASSTDYIRCQQMIADRRRAGRVTVGYSEAMIIADAQAACTSYGVPRSSAQFDRCVQDEFAARRPG